MPFSGRFSFEKCGRQMEESKIYNLKGANCLIVFSFSSFFFGRGIYVNIFLLGRLYFRFDKDTASPSHTEYSLTKMGPSQEN